MTYQPTIEQASDIVALSLLVTALHQLIGEIRGEGQPPHYATMAATEVLTRWHSVAPIMERRAGRMIRAESKKQAAKIKAGMRGVA
jgi:hypothetical protein